MTEVSIYNTEDTANFCRTLNEKMKGTPVFMCIGTDKVFSDSLGPRVGTLLNRQMRTPSFVYGMCEQNITAENLLRCYNFIRALHPSNRIVVIDAVHLFGH